jgi:hypothetical protein
MVLALRPRRSAGVVREAGVMDAADSDEVRLTLPGVAAYGRVARIAAAALALRAGLGFPTVENVRLATDELVVTLLRNLPVDAHVEMAFTVHAGQLDLAAWTEPGELGAGALDTGWDRLLSMVAPLVDHAELGPHADRVSFTFRRPSTTTTATEPN